MKNYAGHPRPVLTGKLTIKGHTREVSIPFTAVPKGKGFVSTVKAASTGKILA